MPGHTRLRAPLVPTNEHATRADATRVSAIRPLSVTHYVDGAAALLTASVRTITDGGGEYTTLHKPLTGRHAVLTLHMRVAQRRGPGARIEFA
jgi:hypothetical protein